MMFRLAFSYISYWSVILPLGSAWLVRPAAVYGGRSLTEGYSNQRPSYIWQMFNDKRIHWKQKSKDYKRRQRTDQPVVCVFVSVCVSVCVWNCVILCMFSIPYAVFVFACAQTRYQKSMRRYLASLNRQDVLPVLDTLLITQRVLASEWGGRAGGLRRRTTDKGQRRVICATFLNLRVVETDCVRLYMDLSVDHPVFRRERVLISRNERDKYI